MLRILFSGILHGRGGVRIFEEQDSLGAGIPVKRNRSRILRLEATLAGALIAVTVVWSSLRELPVWQDLQASASDVAVGLGLTTALCLSLPFFTSSWASRTLLLRDMKGVWDEVLTPFGKSLTLREITILAVLSGLSEELFFRGVLQAEVGILGASLLFGLLHPLNLSYVLWATAVGGMFGLLYQATGSLLPPILCHGGYNFAALLYLRYWYDGERGKHLLLTG